MRSALGAGSLGSAAKAPTHGQLGGPLVSQDLPPESVQDAVIERPKHVPFGPARGGGPGHDELPRYLGSGSVTAGGSRSVVHGSVAFLFTIPIPLGPWHIFNIPVCAVGILASTIPRCIGGPRWPRAQSGAEGCQQVSIGNTDAPVALLPLLPCLRWYGRRRR